MASASVQSELDELMSRIDVEFHGVEEKIKHYQEEQAQEFEGRQRRLEQFVETCDRLQDVWRPRFEAFTQRFSKRVEVVPNITKSRRSARVKFTSNLAQFTLTLSAMTDVDVRHLVLDYTLEVIPVLMQFEKNRQLELPLDNVDPETVGKWIDDCLVEAVKVYLQLHQNAYYLKGHLVHDPIANIDFPQYAAGATLEWKGSTHYFISEESRDAFKAEKQIP